MKLSQVWILTELVRNRCSITATAAKIGLAQSAISRQIQLLEEELGSPLLIRKGKRMLGTTELYSRIEMQIQNMLLSQQNILRIAREHKDVDVGLLRIGTTHTQARFFLPRVVAAFRHQFPQVHLTFEQGAPDYLVTQLRESQIDLAICTEVLETADKLIVDECYKWSHALLVPKGHPLTSKKKALTLAEIAKYPLVTYVSYMTGGSAIMNTFNDAKIETDVAFAVTDSEIIKTYVELGFGVGIIAGMACPMLAQSNDLEVIPLHHLLPESTALVGYLTNSSLPNFAHTFLKILKNEGQNLQSELREMMKRT